MRRTFAILALLGVSLLFLWPTGAHAQTSTQWGQSSYGVHQVQTNGGVAYGDSLHYPFWVDSNGNLHVLESSPAYAQSVVLARFSNTNVAVGAGDSTGVIDARQYKYLRAVIKCTVRSAAIRVTRLAFQVRENVDGNQDSTNTAADVDLIPFTATATIDSIQTGQIESGSSIIQWSGEYVIRIDGTRGASGTASNSDFHWPNAITFGLVDRNGLPKRFMYPSFRIRNMGGSNGTPAVDYTVTIEGFTS